jgi:hypothetical protein
MQRSDEINSLATALAKAQGAMQPVKKNKSARIETTKGGVYTYTYADLADVLEAIRKPLSDNGLALIQTISIETGRVDVETVVAHTSGQWIGNTISLPIMNQDPRSLGSLITYGRRYGLAPVGVVTEADDDAEAGSRPDTQRQKAATEVKRESPPQAPVRPPAGNGHAAPQPEPPASPADAEFAALALDPGHMTSKPELIAWAIDIESAFDHINHAHNAWDVLRRDMPEGTKFTAFRAAWIADVRRRTADIEAIQKAPAAKEVQSG